MIDATFLEKQDNLERYTDSGFQFRMAFYAITKEVDVESVGYLEDMSKMFDGISKHCHLIEQMGFDNTEYHKDLNLIKEYLVHLHETYHPNLDLQGVIDSHQMTVTEIAYPEDFDPPEDEITFIDDLDCEGMGL